MNAPIVLFVYNRPQHTRRTVDALLKNSLAAESELFVYSDAPKTTEAENNVREVRSYIKSVHGFRSISITERDTNWGLANSIIDGVSKLTKECGRVIVLEDDLVTSPYFLKFMNDSLNTYKNHEKVMHISGCTYPIKPLKEDLFFLRVPLCWGWATWARAWQYFRKDNDIMLSFDEERRRALNFNYTYNYWNQLVLNANGSIDTWFIYWYATIFLRQCMALFPGRSLVNNIGMDGSGIHCTKESVYDVQLSRTPVNVVAVPVVESLEATKRHEEYFRKHFPAQTPRRAILRRILGRIRNAGVSTIKEIGKRL